jgi:hypothetical protein
LDASPYIGIDQLERPSNIILRHNKVQCFYCCSTFHSHSRMIYNEHSLTNTITNAYYISYINIYLCTNQTQFLSIFQISWTEWMEAKSTHRTHIYGRLLGTGTTGAWGMDFVSSSPFSLLLPLFSKFSYKSFFFQNFHNHSFFLHLTISVDVIHHE